MNKYLIHHNLTKRNLRSAWAQRPSVQYPLNVQHLHINQTVALKYICDIFVTNNIHSTFFPLF